MKDLRVIAITHNHFTLEEVGQFHLTSETRNAVLHSLKQTLGIEELMYLSTCNRVEFIFTAPHYVCSGFATSLIAHVHPTWTEEKVKATAIRSQRCNGEEAVDHLLRVSASLDSVILGEQEIITQIRKSYEECAHAQLSGDGIRLMMKQCIKTSKDVITNTNLAKKPVSAVSLAWQAFQQRGLSKQSRIVVVGAGQVMRNFCKFLHENNYNNVLIANRTITRAQELADTFGYQCMNLDDLNKYEGGFDVLVSCTGATHTVVSHPLYHQLLINEQDEKLIIDMALPADVDSEVMSQHAVEYIGMQHIQKLAESNVQYRQQALADCEAIITQGKLELEKMAQQRQIEQAMRAIPEAVKEIRNTALGSVFAKDLQQLDEQSREVIEKIMAYMEKKYISIPMKMAREVLMNEAAKN
ncbi:MAG: glutamyl-tRNA reductase [Flavobacteriales bacterium]